MEFTVHIKTFVAWSLQTFKEATSFSSLIKLREEINEAEEALNTTTLKHEIAEEYADCLMCVFDSAARAGISPDTVINHFKIKLYKNMHRKWRKNADNTYSHE